MLKLDHSGVIAVDMGGRPRDQFQYNLFLSLIKSIQSYIFLNRNLTLIKVLYDKKG